MDDYTVETTGDIAAKVLSFTFVNGSGFSSPHGLRSGDPGACLSSSCGLADFSTCSWLWYGYSALSRVLPSARWSFHSMDSCAAVGGRYDRSGVHDLAAL